MRKIFTSICAVLVCALGHAEGDTPADELPVQVKGQLFPLISEGSEGGKATSAPANLVGSSTDGTQADRGGITLGAVFERVILLILIVMLVGVVWRLQRGIREIGEKLTQVEERLKNGFEKRRQFNEKIHRQMEELNDGISGMRSRRDSIVDPKPEVEREIQVASHRFSSARPDELVPELPNELVPDPELADPFPPQSRVPSCDSAQESIAGAYLIWCKNSDEHSRQRSQCAFKEQMVAMTGRQPKELYWDRSKRGEPHFWESTSACAGMKDQSSALAITDENDQSYLVPIPRDVWDTIQDLKGFLEIDGAAPALVAPNRIFSITPARIVNEGRGEWRCAERGRISFAI
jgi:hypothetical protein